MEPQSPRAVLDHILESISPASGAQAAAARARIAGQLAPGEDLGKLLYLVERLCAARHSPRPTIDRRAALLVAADHGVAWPGLDLGADAPTVIALRHIAAGEAAVCAAARTARAPLTLIDAGVRGGERHALGRGVLGFRLGDGTESIAEGPAMTLPTAIAALQTGIAIMFSLAESGAELVALGQIAPGSEPSSGAVIAALTGTAASAFGVDAEVIATALGLGLVDPTRPIDVLATVGGFETGVLAGAILAAASVHLPIVLDDHGTWAAALIAAGLAPAVTGYLVASHAGGASPGHRRALTALGLDPVFDLGLAHGEGTGALLAVPLLEAAAAVVSA